MFRQREIPLSVAHYFYDGRSSTAVVALETDNEIQLSCTHRVPSMKSDRQCFKQTTLESFSSQDAGADVRVGRGWEASSKTKELQFV